MKMAKILLASSLAFAAATAFAQGKPSEYTEKDLVWQEDFNGKKLNTKDWNYEFHEPGWVNAELQRYDDSKKNTYLKNGCLVIQAIKEEKKDGTVHYSSGRINTQGKHAYTYGRFEARLRVPKGKGFLPAFWMMPDDESYYGQWPKCGEIDIMEVLGDDVTKLYGTLHFGEPHAMVQGTQTLASGNFADEFHTFAVEWEPGEIRWYCDGVNYKTANDWFTKRPGFAEQSYPAPFDQPFYVILNVAVGGSWVGYPDDTTDFDPKKDDAKMYVDYVKIYQKKEYNEDVDKPAKAPVVAKTDASGNMVSQRKDAWEFLTAGGGAGSVDTDGSNHTIKSSNAGSLDYSVQYVQAKVPLNQGYTYRYSFDASADEERTMITGISAPNNSYERRFGDVKVKLTPKKQHFSYEFNMMADSDPECRIEYNCGAQGSTAAIHISNVRLEKIGEIDLSMGKSCLPDGNYIMNGQFQEGKARLGSWEIDNKAGAEISVTKDRARMLKIVSPKKAKPEDVTIRQTGIKLEKGMHYVVKFDGYSTKTTFVNLKYGDIEQKVRLMPGKTDPKTKAVIPGHFEWAYTPDSDKEIDFALMVGSDGATIFVDNIFVKENKVVMNGDFERDMTGWELYAHQNASASCQVTGDKDKKAVEVQIDNTGNLDWMIQLKQNGCLLEKGKAYKISLKAKSTLERTIMLALQRDGSKDDNWYPYSNTLKFPVGPEMKDYSWNFSMGMDSDPNVIFTISMGAVSDKIITQSHTITIDSIVVEEVQKK
ncbi:MAG: carbohydrate binding domain-containing protein [Treponema sp.]|uniref:carbohydrate binding domain-containing protein n=2 Tax=Treponema TaxID=157 RepID=UPI0026369B67|nr:carbohydrate binding domain-containing protein [uncultured Treponema sp.]MBR4321715.1 carbohydrate binding domain-containing protein [Treponema sp.]